MEWKLVSNRIQIFRTDGVIELSFPKRGGIRLRWGAWGAEAAYSLVLENEPDLLKCIAIWEDETLTISADKLNFSISEDGSMRASENGRIWWSAPACALEANKEITRMRFYSPEEDSVYGLGQDPIARLDHNHQERRMWNQWGGHEHSGNCGIGFFLSTGGYGMLLATPAAARFCFNESVPPLLDPLGEAMVSSPWDAAMPQPQNTACLEVLGSMDVFVLSGTPDDLLRQYHWLTGFPRLMPKWAYGFLQCKNRYMNRIDLLTTAQRLRMENLPCDGLIIDWLWFKEMGDLKWHEDDWPHAAEMLSQLAEMGFYVSSAQHPFIWKDSCNYSEFLEKGFLNNTPPQTRFTYDHTNPEAQTFWWEKTSELYRQGLRGYWTDMGELEEHFEGTQSFAGDRLKIHNAYSLFWAQGLYEGQRRDFGTRPFILSRSACAGLQRYGAAMWSGDVNATWQVLRDQVVLGQGMAMSGFPWWGTDIGGFLCGEECTPELYVRWMEWGVFCGLFRTHGTRPGNEAWCFGGQAGKKIRSLIRLRYTLMPYIYSLAMACALHGKPLVRPLAYEYPNDEQAAKCTGEFFFGPAFLVVPITESGARTANVYLPEGTWQCWWTGKQYVQGWHKVVAPLGEPPLFVRAGSVIPVFREIGRNVADCRGLSLWCVPGEQGSFDYYDDDGFSYDYEQGKYTHIRFTCRNGVVVAQKLRGTMTAYTVETLQAQSSRDIISLDCGWRGEEAEIILTAIEPIDGLVSLEPEKGWNVVSCTTGGCEEEMYEAVYQNCWKKEICVAVGETVRWKLVHTACARRVAEQKAVLTLYGKAGEQRRAEVCWDGPFLSNPSILGCLPARASAAGFAPERDAQQPYYKFEGQIFEWKRDVLYKNNCFGYVDFRRFAPQRDGEAIMGEAWAKEELYTEKCCLAEFDLRYDGPITIWLNGDCVFRGLEKNSPQEQIQMRLCAGKNTLVLRQIVDVKRPYSGGEFGYSLHLNNSIVLYTLK